LPPLPPNVMRVGADVFGFCASSGRTPSTLIRTVLAKIVFTDWLLS
jgi:hypothetical protein